MNSLSRYLEQAKVEELMQQLEVQGYQVEREVALPNGEQPHRRLDLVARKGDQVIAYEIKAGNALPGAAAQLAYLRSQARQAGYNDFRLVVVWPPRRVDVEVEGLASILLESLQSHMPSALVELPGRMSITDVADIEIDKLRVSADRIFVRGASVVRVELNDEGEDNRDGLALDEPFLCRFQLDLSHDLQIIDAEIEVDTSSWHE